MIRRGWLGLAALAVVAAGAASLFVGAKAIPPDTVIQALLGDDVGVDGLLITQQRLPRTLVALIAGAALGAAGILMQSLTRNPIADPGVLGVSSGATLLMVIGIVTGIATSQGARVLTAMVGAATVSALVAIWSHSAGRKGDPMVMTIVGVALTAACQGVVLVITLTDPTTFDATRSWNVGSVIGVDLHTAAWIAPWILGGLATLPLLARGLNAIVLGDDVAAALGTSVAPLRIAVFLVVVILAGAATAGVGPVGFVGLLAGQLVRRWLGPSHGELLAAGALVGAGLLTLADVGGRLVIWPEELAAGTVVALLGAPLLLVAIRRRSLA